MEEDKIKQLLKNIRSSADSIEYAEGYDFKRQYGLSMEQYQIKELLRQIREATKFIENFEDAIIYHYYHNFLAIFARLSGLLELLKMGAISNGELKNCLTIVIKEYEDILKEFKDKFLKTEE
jgi:hypothetical protein